MPGPRITGLLGVVLIAAALLIALVSHTREPQTEADKPADQILRDAVVAYQKAGSVAVTAHYVQDGNQASLDATSSLAADFQGSITIGGVYFDFVQAGGRSFLHTEAGRTGIRSVDPGLVASLKGTYWYLASLDEAGRGLGQLLDRKLFGKMLLAGRANLVKDAVGVVDGHRAVRIHDAIGEVFVSVDGTPYPIRVRTASGVQTGDGFGDLELTLSHYGPAVTASPPATYIDPLKITTFPARFRTKDIRFGQGCAVDGCTILADLVNDGGPGTSNAQFQLLDSGGKALANCSAPVPRTESGVAVTVSCKASSSAWTDYFNQHYYSDGVDFSGQVSVDNSAYS